MQRAAAVLAGLLVKVSNTPRVEALLFKVGYFNLVLINEVGQKNSSEQGWRAGLLLQSFVVGGLV